LLITSCNNTPKTSSKTDTPKISSKTEKLFIKTVSATGTGENQKSTETISEVTSDYFEIKLAALTDVGYGAQKDVITPEVGKEFKYVFFYIVNEDGSNIKFTTSTEFLNYMSLRGYEMVDQIKNEYGTDYIFKKK
jgi:uncharacterized lipoprotein YajG